MLVEVMLVVVEMEVMMMVAMEMNMVILSFKGWD